MLGCKSISFSSSDLSDSTVFNSCNRVAIRRGLCAPNCINGGGGAIIFGLGLKEGAGAGAEVPFRLGDGAGMGAGAAVGNGAGNGADTIGFLDFLGISVSEMIGFSIFVLCSVGLCEGELGNITSLSLAKTDTEVDSDTDGDKGVNLFVSSPLTSLRAFLRRFLVFFVLFWSKFSFCLSASILLMFFSSITGTFKSVPSTLIITSFE